MKIKDELTNELIFERLAFEKRLKRFKENLEEPLKITPLSKKLMGKFNKIKKKVGIKDEI